MDTFCLECDTPVIDRALCGDCRIKAEDALSLVQFVKRRMKFLAWLKKKNIYYSRDSPVTLIRMQIVWTICGSPE